MTDVTYVGTVGALVEKKAGWYSIEISVPGKQYPVKADTKLEHLINQARELRDAGHVATFTVREEESENINPKNGLPYMERRLQKVEPGAALQSSPAADVSPTSASKDQMSKDEWGQKDSAIHRMAATKAAADALKHTIPADPSAEDLRAFIERVKLVSYQWWLQADAVRKGDDSDVPFLSEHDDDIPY